MALLQLGRKDRALSLLEWLLDDQRPPAWRQWPELAWRDARAPRFLGDLPHGWVAATFVRTIRRLLVDERADGTLIVAPGVPEAWVREEPGVRVHGLATHYGPLDYTLCATGDGRVRATFGSGLRRPPGGIVLVSPLARPLREAIVDGRPCPVVDAGSIHMEQVPREVVLCY